MSMKCVICEKPTTGLSNYCAAHQLLEDGGTDKLKPAEEDVRDHRSSVLGFKETRETPPKDGPGG